MTMLLEENGKPAQNKQHAEELGSYLDVVEEVESSIGGLEQRHAQGRGLNWGQEERTGP